jgi:hypothetical protein
MTVNANTMGNSFTQQKVSGTLFLKIMACHFLYKKKIICKENGMPWFSRIGPQVIHDRTYDYYRAEIEEAIKSDPKTFFVYVDLKKKRVGYSSDMQFTVDEVRCCARTRCQKRCELRWHTVTVNPFLTHDTNIQERQVQQRRVWLLHLQFQRVWNCWFIEQCATTWRNWIWKGRQKDIGRLTEVI